MCRSKAAARTIAPSRVRNTTSQTAPMIARAHRHQEQPVVREEHAEHLGGPGDRRLRRAAGSAPNTIFSASSRMIARPKVSSSVRMWRSLRVEDALDQRPFGDVADRPPSAAASAASAHQNGTPTPSSATAA